MGFFRQHERLRIPQFWKGEERSFVTQLDGILDKLFNLKIGKHDLTAELEKEIVDKLGQPVLLSSGDDCNDATASGLYAISTGVANAPKTWCAMLVVNLRGAVYQIAFSRDRAYVRDYTGDPLNWSGWTPISVMGGTLSNNKDLNTVIVPGFYLLSSNYTYTNKPTGADALLVLRSSSTAMFVVQIAFGVNINPQRRYRTAADTWSAWTAYANDASVVHKTGNETISGTKTFTYALLFEREAVTAPGTQYSVLRARFKSQDGTVQFETVPVRIIGSNAANGDNAGIAIGSNSGITVVGAGEGSAMFTSKNSVYNGEDMYLVSDGFIRMYTGVANDGTVKGHYQFPALAAGTAIDVSRLLTAINGNMPTAAIPSGADLDTYKTPGSYYIQNSTVAGTLAHCPWTGCGGRIDIIETYNASGNYVRQIGHMGGGNPHTFIRESNSSGAFGSWYKINMTSV